MKYNNSKIYFPNLCMPYSEMTSWHASERAVYNSSNSCRVD